MFEHSSLLLVSGPEFHEEWLRDGPCDATTTGLSNSGSGVNSLPVVGNMRFGVPDLKSDFWDLKILRSDRISLFPASVVKYRVRHVMPVDLVSLAY
jgi:hypothetical protein